MDDFSPSRRSRGWPSEASWNRSDQSTNKLRLAERGLLGSLGQSKKKRRARLLLGRARRQRQRQPVQPVVEDDLAAQPRRLALVEGRVDQVFLAVLERRQLAVPGFIDPHMARRAGARAAALGLDVEAIVADHFHRPPAVEPFELVRLPRLVGADDLHYATPSFFCSLVLDVVYWNTILSAGLMWCLAACAISAASWKPERISFGLPA